MRTSTFVGLVGNALATFPLIRHLFISGVVVAPEASQGGSIKN